MMTRDADKKRSQMLMFCMDDMVPQDHLLWSSIFVTLVAKKIS